MKQNTLDFLCCPICKGSLSLSIRKKLGEEIQSGRLLCDSCSEEYRIVSDRPILMGNNTIHNWLSPIDEALNPNEITLPEGPFSLLRLKRLGVEEAKELASSQANQSIPDNAFSVRNDLKQLQGKIKYIKSGKWLRARDRGKKWLNSLNNPSESVKSFLSLAESRNPDSLLDIASGGGSGVASLADVLPAKAKVFSVERDLKCLWIIQEKFKHIRKQANSESIGADVRQLPIKNDSIGVVTSMMAMQELLGVSSVLEEIHRVLKPGGSYIALFNKEPWVYDMIQIDQYKRFAKAVDMYSGYPDLVATAENESLSLKGLEEFIENGKEYCLVEFGKEKK
ncbi:methyltransferase domain-containing protein [bacterium]|nr:methyltransferase domain-containing protein [candidate division CSSED10-310 bacterium]